MDAWSRHPHNDDSPIEGDLDSDEVEVISYSFVCKLIDSYLDTTTVPNDLKEEALSISYMVQSFIEEAGCRGKLMVC